MLKFLVKMNLFAIPLYIILFLGLSFAPMQKTVADTVFYLLSAAGMNPVMNGLIISIPIKNGSWAAFIDWDCTGWKSLLAFLALVMATEAKMNKKMLGLAIFLPLIFIVNIIRIFAMFMYVSVYDIENYAVVHSIVWSLGMIITILVFWMVWMTFFNMKTKRNKYIPRRR